MLEDGFSLLTWSFEPQPNLLEHKTVRVDAKRLPAHRLEYLDYEGEVSDNRGSVRCIMKGNYMPMLRSRAFLMGENGLMYLAQLYEDGLAFLPMVEVECDEDK
jgi:hypothetical protein